jgi:hypothetical protein
MASVFISDHGSRALVLSKSPTILFACLEKRLQKSPEE